MIKWKIWTVNDIGDEGAIKISESLKTNTALTSLYLGGDKNWNRMELIIMVKNMKQWMNEVRSILSDNDKTEDKEVEMIIIMIKR